MKETTIPVTPGQSGYLVEPVTRTLEMIKNYRPANLHLYAPERVTLWVFLEENIRLGLANPTPEPPVLKWTVDEINLNDFLLTDLVTSKPKVISGEMLSFVMQQVKHIPVVRQVEQKRQNHRMIVCPNFTGGRRNAAQHSPALRDLRRVTEPSIGSGQALDARRVFRYFRASELIPAKCVSPTSPQQDANATGNANL